LTIPAFAAGRNGPNPKITSSCETVCEYVNPEKMVHIPSVSACGDLVSRALSYN